MSCRDITSSTKVHIVKALVFPEVVYRCESWTIKKAECQRIDAFLPPIESRKIIYSKKWQKYEIYPEIHSYFGIINFAISLWDRFSLEHVLLLIGPLETYYHVTVFKHFADSRVVSRQEPSFNPQNSKERVMLFLRRTALLISEEYT